ncbi:tetratricopeptide repeat protein [Nocardia sp. NPDC050175]|uniref:serine/threonine-protein kinase n=1 Tax=Nocardia sp. NPDC050175 TaxID=3364317 RepID=UPI0037A8FFAE
MGEGAPRACAEPGCGGTVRDGFCDECGLAPADPRPLAASVRTVAGPMLSARARRGSSRSSSRSTRSARSSRGRLGAGLVAVAPVPYRDPASAIMVEPKVAEQHRFCGTCDKPVGRANGGRPGRVEGFCKHCGTAYSFEPKLVAGDLVAGQYEVLGCLAHGGLGWIYLARDRNVNDRWVVLKGLLDTGDADAMAAAAAERQFLASVEHPNIVKIYNFVEHPDPKTGKPVGYIVMEYVGGNSLKELRSRLAADGRLEPLPLAQGLAYILEILPALGYLHEQGLLYCDFKPDNVIQSEEQLKLIDLGAVRRHDDQDSAGYKTDGYCAPELESDGASIESDLFTVGRTLAVLTVNFDFRGRFRYTLPEAADIPLFASNPSFYRLITRATATDPNVRFGSAAELAEQVTGVLREVVAAQDGAPKPAPSAVFGTERAVFGVEIDSWPTPPRPRAVASALPVPLVDMQDPAARYLATVTTSDPRQLEAASAAVPGSVELALALIRARLEIGEFDSARSELDALEQTEDADWRITWYRGLAALAAGDAHAAQREFEISYGTLPGEPAAKLALAAAHECAAEYAAAAALYEAVWRTDHGYVSAAFGAARTRLALQDIAGAVAVAESVPATSSFHRTAQLVAIRCRVAGGADERYLVEAGALVAALDLDAEQLALTSIHVLDAARRMMSQSPAMFNGSTVLGCTLDERSVRGGLERQYRALARLARDKAERRALINRANAIRPVTWV